MQAVAVDEEISDSIELSERDKMRANQAVKVNPHVNFVEFHHPDGTTSVIACPLKEPHRSTRIRYYLKKRNPFTGERWFFANRVTPAPIAKYNCFVEGSMGKCQKKLHNLSDLLMHAEAKHPQECQRYGDLINAIRSRLSSRVDPELLREVGLMPPEGEEPAEIVTSTVDVGIIRCPQCEWHTLPEHKRPEFALQAHTRAKHKEPSHEERQESVPESGSGEGAEPAGE